MGTRRRCGRRTIFAYESEGKRQADCLAKLGCERIYYAWKRKYGGMDESDARRMRALEDEPSAARSPAEGSRKGKAKPGQNGHIERFHDKLRDECLNRELFGSLLEARVVLETWRTEYNESRSRSSLGYQTLGKLARRTNSGLPTLGVAINTKTNHKQ